MNYRLKLTCQRPTKSSRTEPEDLISETESNRGRIIQSAAVRRLQQKTQVYPLETNAAVRSRLTHSLEVQQTGRFLARTILQRLSEHGELEKCGLNGIETAFVNLVEMACLMHDIGNPPMGHFGEDTISRWMRTHAENCHRSALSSPETDNPLFEKTLLPDLCNYEGNAQAVRIIHHLQHLNLTYSQIAALMKYTRPPYEEKPAAGNSHSYRKKKPGFFFSESHLVAGMWQHLQIEPGCRFPLVYIMEAADDISYCIADLEDALDKGILSYDELKRRLLEEWEKLAPNNCYLPAIVKSASERAEENQRTFIVHLRTRLIWELVEYASKRYLNNHQAVFSGTLDEPLIDGQSDQHLALDTLKSTAIQHVFTSKEKETPELRGYSALVGLMDIFRPILELSADDFIAIVRHDESRHFLEQRLCHRLSTRQKQAYLKAITSSGMTAYSEEERTHLEWYYRARLLIDYISGMTDNYVLTEYQTLSAI